MQKLITLSTIMGILFVVLSIVLFLVAFLSTELVLANRCWMAFTGGILLSVGVHSFVVARQELRLYNKTIENQRVDKDVP